MVQIRLARVITVFIIMFVFTKIYQHNRIIKLNYERQRLDMRKNDLTKEYNDLTMKLCSLKDVGSVQSCMQDRYGMKKMKFSQVFTFTGF